MARNGASPANGWLADGAHLSLWQDGRHKVVVMTPAYPERFRSLLGGTGHWPVLPGDPPGR
jgi:hypothetical protein